MAIERHLVAGKRVEKIVATVSGRIGSYCQGRGEA